MPIPFPLAPQVRVIRTLSKTPGRTGWEIMVADQKIAEGYCAEVRFPGAAFSALQDATERPYELIQRSFSPIETKDMSEITTEEWQAVWDWLQQGLGLDDEED